MMGESQSSQGARPRPPRAGTSADESVRAGAARVDALAGARRDGNEPPRARAAHDRRHEQAGPDGEPPRARAVNEARLSSGGSSGSEPPRAGAATEDQRVFEAASMYYVQAETMEVIARHLRCSRSTASRLLARARRKGIVRIELVHPGEAGGPEARFEAEFGVRAHIVPVREGTTEIHRLQQVAAVAASRFVELAGGLAEARGPDGAGDSDGAGGPGNTNGAVGSDGRDEDDDAGLVVGSAWGTTMSEVAAALPTRRIPGLTIVQLNGSSDPVHEGPSAGRMLSQMGSSLGARTIGFPVPAFFDRAGTRRAMWSERSIKRVLAVAAAARLAVFGVGTLETGSGALPSQVYAGGHLSRADLAVARREGVVGDVCTVLLRADGTWGDIDLNARATGPTPVRLARIPRRLCVVAGTGKVRACLAALRAHVATDLVIDDATARAVLALYQRKETP